MKLVPLLRINQIIPISSSGERSIREHLLSQGYVVTTKRESQNADSYYLSVSELKRYVDKRIAQEQKWIQRKCDDITRWRKFVEEWELEEKKDDSASTD